MKQLIYTLVLCFFTITNLTAQCTGPTNDCDGDGIVNDIDLDDDNDGILDALETGQGSVQWTSTQLANFRTTSFNASLPCGVPINFQCNPLNTQLTSFSASAVNYNNVLTADMGTATTIPFVSLFAANAPNNGSIGNFTLTFAAGSLFQFNLYLSDPEYTSFIISAYDASNNLISTSDWSTATYETNGTSPADAIGTITTNPTDITYTATNVAQNNDVFRVRLGEGSLLTATKIVIDIRRVSTNTSGDGIYFFVSGICRPNTDGDGTPNYQDNDSDGDGCPDAIEGGASFMYSNTDMNGRLTGSVGTNGVPTISGTPQTVGTAYNSSIPDAQSACELPVSYPITNPLNGAPLLTNLGSMPLQGSDGADQPVQGTWAGKTLSITSLPTAGFILKYNNVPVSAGQIVSNYTPALLTIEPGVTTPIGTMSTSFQYATIDAAGQQATTATSYMINWALALPINLLSFTAKEMGECKLMFLWEAREENSLGKYVLEQSENSRDFKEITSVNAKGEKQNQYSFYYDNNFQSPYFRLKCIDRDGSVSYSKTIYHKSPCDRQTDIGIYPNPATDKIEITGTKRNDKLTVYNATGHPVLTRTTFSQNTVIDISSLPKGIYTIMLTGDNKLIKTFKIIKQ